MNILDIRVAVVSTSEEGLHIIYPTASNRNQEEADFDSIALLGNEAESDCHSLQQMDAKTTDLLEELKLKYGDWRITHSEDQIFPKCGKN